MEWKWDYRDHLLNLYIYPKVTTQTIWKRPSGDQAWEELTLSIPRRKWEPLTCLISGLERYTVWIHDTFHKSMTGSKRKSYTSFPRTSKIDTVAIKQPLHLEDASHHHHQSDQVSGEIFRDLIIILYIVSSHGLNFIDVLIVMKRHLD